MLKQLGLESQKPQIVAYLDNYGYSEYARKVRKLCKFYGKTIDDYDKVVLNRES